MAMQTSLTINDAELKAKMAELGPKLNVACFMYASTEAVRLEHYMKQNRPWTDRTGLAKQRLNARVSQVGSSKIRITLAHGVSYGIWLELAHGKNYAVIKPTIDHEAPRVFKGMQGLLNKVAGA